MVVLIKIAFQYNQNKENKQNLLCAICAQGTLFSANYRQ